MEFIHKMLIVFLVVSIVVGLICFDKEVTTITCRKFSRFPNNNSNKF